MGACRETHRVKVMSVMIVACLLAAVTLSASPPQGRLQASVAPSAKPVADELALILQRLKAQIAVSGDPHDPRAAREPNYARTTEWLSSETADGHWADIEYTDRAGGGWNPTMHLNRLVQMAGSFANPASPDYHWARRLEGVEQGLEFWYKQRPISENWWENTIGQPLQLARILVPLEDVLPANLMRQGLSYFSGYTEIDPQIRHWLAGNPDGADLVWYAQQQVIRGVLTRSSEDIAAGSEWMQKEIRISTFEGIQRDFSFHQHHGPELYNGGYGRDFVLDLARFATLLEGTRYAFGHERLSLLADYLLEGTGKMIRGKLLDYSADGRTLVRRGASEGAVVYIATCDELAALLPERAPELMALKKHIEGDGASYSFLGNRYFWNSDFMTHQREAYYISVKMVSRRTIGVESMNSENLKGCWLPFGANWIVRRGDEYKDIFPVLDWGRLPSVTSLHMTMGCPVDVTQPESFVGGVSDGTYGAAAMVFDQSHLFPPLRPETLKPPGHPESVEKGRKAWFFFDREMVALGAGISATRDEPMETTLNQTLLHGPVVMNGHEVQPGGSKVPQGAWVLHDEVGYALLGSTDASLKFGPQTGDWKSIGMSNSNAPVTEQVFALWIDHGVRPRFEQYAYAVLPGINAQQLAEWEAHPPVRVITNIPLEQAVINDHLGVAEIVFYRPGSLPLSPGLTVKVDQPCLVLATKHGNSTRLAVSSPGGEFITIHLTVTTPHKERSVTFTLPDGDRAGKSQVMEVPVRW
jgi:chondroitin AC lyase